MSISSQDPIKPVYPTIIPVDLEAKIWEVFIGLPLAEKLLVYAKYKHARDFKAANDDFFGLSRRKATDITTRFLKAVREGL